MILGNIEPGTWNHAALTWDSSGNGSGYLNGDLTTTKTGITFTSTGIDNQVSIGTYNDGLAGQFFAGQIDDVRIWNTTRTAEQIDVFKNQQITGNEGGTLLGNYRFDDSTADNTVTNVANAGTNDGTYTNGASTVPFLGNGVSFDGVDDVVSIANHSSLESTTGTWSVWVKTDADWGVDNDDQGTGTKGSAGLLTLSDTTGSLNGPSLYVNASGQVIWEQKNTNGTAIGSATTSSSISDGNWHQVTVTWNTASGSQQKVYIDGQVAAVSTTSAAWTFGSNDNALRIGNAGDAFWEEFKGEVADVRIWNTGLTDGQVADQFTNPPAPGDANLIGHYTFDETSGTTATNSATAGSKPGDATITGATRIEAVFAKLRHRQLYPARGWIDLRRHGACRQLRENRRHQRHSGHRRQRNVDLFADGELFRQRQLYALAHRRRRDDDGNHQRHSDGDACGQQRDRVAAVPVAGRHRRLRQHGHHHGAGQPDQHVHHRGLDQPAHGQ